MTRPAVLALLVTLIALPLQAAPQLKAPPKKVPALEGTRWAGETAEGWAMTIDFVAEGKMKVTYNGNTYTVASWKQDGDKVYWEMNNKYCEFNGKFAGDTIEGDSHNVAGRQWPTRMTRVRE